MAGIMPPFGVLHGTNFADHLAFLPTFLPTFCSKLFTFFFLTLTFDEMPVN